MLERGRRWTPTDYPRKPGGPLDLQRRASGEAQRLARPAPLQADDRRAGRRRRRRLACLQQRRARGASRHASTRDGRAEMYVRRAEAVLRPRRAGPEPADAFPTASSPQRLKLTREAAGEARPRRSLLEGAAGGVVLAGLALRTRRSVRPKALAIVRQRARAAAGHLHPPRPLRHRLRRSCEERAWTSRIWRPRSGTAARCGRSTWCVASSRAIAAIASSSIASSQGRARARRRQRRPCLPRRRQSRLHRAAAAGARRAPHAAEAVAATLGARWRPNANVLSMATYPDGDRVQSIGRPDDLVLDRLHGRLRGRSSASSIEDDGFPNLLLNALRVAD